MENTGGGRGGLTARDVDTVLAALRQLQSPHTWQEVRDIAPDHGQPLDNAEIDDLCEYLNSNAYPQDEHDCTNQDLACALCGNVVQTV